MNMRFDPENHIVKLCAEGMEHEGAGRKEDAALVFEKAWNEASTDLERFVAAHYVARRQPTVADKLKWDQTALELALKLPDENTRGAYPSLYLNVGKCYEDLEQHDKALANYQLAFSHAHFLQEDGYGRLIRSGIEQGIKRMQQSKL